MSVGDRNIKKEMGSEEKKWKDSQSIQDSGDAEPISVFFNNVPPDTQLDMLQTLYPTSLNIELPLDGQGKCLGYAVVEFSTLEEASKIVESSKTRPVEIGGVKVKVHIVGHEEPETMDSSTLSDTGDLKRKHLSEGPLKIKKLREDQEPYRFSQTNPDYGQPSWEGEWPMRSPHSSGEFSTPWDPPMQRPYFPQFMQQNHPMNQPMGPPQGFGCPPSSGPYFPEQAMPRPGPPMGPYSMGPSFMGGPPREMYPHPPMLQQDYPMPPQAYGFPPQGYPMPPYAPPQMQPQAPPQMPHQASPSMATPPNLMPPQSLPGSSMGDFRTAVSSTQEVNKDSCEDVEGFEVVITNLPKAKKEDIELFFKVQFILRGLCNPNDVPIVGVKFKAERNFQLVVLRTAAFAETFVREFDGVTFKGSKLLIQHKVEESTDSGKLQEDEPIQNNPDEYEVYFGNVPACRPSEFLEFIKTEFRSKGLCQASENPVKRLNFKKDRDYQYVVFTHSADAIAAVEEINNQVFKGNKIVTNALQIKEFNERGITDDLPQTEESKDTKSLDSGKVHRKEEWTCPNESCGISNFITRRKCRKCRTPNLQCENRTGGEHSERPRDSKNNWFCVDCGAPNYPNRESCRKCEYHKPDDEEVLNQGKSTVYIVNLPSEMTKEDLNRCLHEKLVEGGVCKENQKIIRYMRSEGNRKFEITTFYNREDAVKAVEVLNGCYIGDHQVTAKLKRAQGGVGSSYQDLSKEDLCKLYFENLSDHISPKDLEMHVWQALVQRGVAQYGYNPIQECNVMPGRSFQYIKFDREMTARRAFESLGGFTVEGRKIKIFHARAMKARLLEQASAKLFIGNLLGEADHAALKDFLIDRLVRFGVCSNDNHSIIRAYKIPGKPFGFAIFGNRSIAERSVTALNDAIFDGHVLRVSLGEKSAQKNAEDGHKDSMTDDSIQSDRLSRTKIFIGNIPVSITNEDLKDFIWDQLVKNGVCSPETDPIPKIQRIETQQFAFVILDSPELAEQAIQVLDQVLFYGQPLKVRFAIKKGRENQPNQPVEDKAQPYRKAVAKVYIGNLPQRMIENEQSSELKNFLLGELIRRRICTAETDPIVRMLRIPKKTYAFALFHSKEIAEASAEALDTIDCYGCSLSVLLSDKNKAKQKSEIASVDDIPDQEGWTKVFVGNLPRRALEDESSDVLKSFLLDQLINEGVCPIGTNPIAKIKRIPYRAYCFVFFTSPEMAEKAVHTLDGIMFNGHPLKIELGSSNTNTTGNEPDAQAENSEHQVLVNVFIGNLPRFAEQAVHSDMLKKCLEEELVKHGVCSPGDHPIMFMKVFPNKPYQLASFRSVPLAKKAAPILDGLFFGGQNIRAIIEQRKVMARGNLEVFVGNVPNPITLKEFSTAIEGALIDSGLCRPEESIIYRYKFQTGRRFQHIVFYNRDYARQAVPVLRNVYLHGNRLNPDMANKVHVKRS